VVGKTVDGEEISPAEYQEYLKSDHWANFTVEARMRLPYRCVACGNRGNGKPLHLHHRSYDNLGAETLDEVIFLCGWCHRKTHRITPKVGLWEAHLFI
jgi:5-methylcytosine-specific restriction endonuclease McrA